jgi:hypothetical protein
MLICLGDGEAPTHAPLIHQRAFSDARNNTAVLGPEIELPRFPSRPGTESISARQQTNEAVKEISSCDQDESHLTA